MPFSVVVLPLPAERAPPPRRAAVPVAMRLRARFGATHMKSNHWVTMWREGGWLRTTFEVWAV